MKKSTPVGIGSLRLPVPFMDLLLGLVTLFLLLMSPHQPDPMTKSLLTARDAEKPAGPMLLVVPQHDGAGWSFHEVGARTLISADALAARAHREGRKIVIVAESEAKLQDYIKMTDVLQKSRVQFAIAVQKEDK
jgi:biopolymer transport protein ExbD